MITRRENLLIRPWQQRRYDNHRKKVQSAKPAIDNKPPAARQHVITKLKKKQKEDERCEEIQKNNFTLLRRLSHAMRTSRVDNYWTTPQPNFLNRIGMYNAMLSSFDHLNLDDLLDEPETNHPQTVDRRSKCAACTPQPQPSPQIPEERIPWEPDKQKIIRRERSQSLQPTKSVPLSTQRKIVSKSANYKRHVKSGKSKVEPKPQKKQKQLLLPDAELTSQRIILSRGCLKLAVNFPPDSLVKLQEGNQEKVLVQGLCNCKQEIGVN